MKKGSNHAEEELFGAITLSKLGGFLPSFLPSSDLVKQSDQDICKRILRMGRNVSECQRRGDFNFILYSYNDNVICLSGARFRRTGNSAAHREKHVLSKQAYNIFTC